MSKPIFSWHQSHRGDSHRLTSATRANSRALHWAVLSLALVAMSLGTGCHRSIYSGSSQLVDNTFLSYRDHVWANRAYNLTYRGDGRKYGEHHRKGFIAGYCSACQGGDGYVPALPPEDYWSYEYKSDEGARCVEAWYEGYPEGVAAARKMGAEKFRSIYVSKMVDAAIANESGGAVLPSEKPSDSYDALDEHAPVVPPAPSRLALPKIPILGQGGTGIQQR